MSIGNLSRRMVPSSAACQKVIIEPTSYEETIEILNNVKGKYEDHHHVKYTPEAIEACVKLTSRYITDRFLPDKGARCYG